MQGHTDRSLVASEGVVGRPLGDVGRGTSEVACQTGPLKTAPLAQVSFEPPSASSSCLETIQRFARARGVPSDVAQVPKVAKVAALLFYLQVSTIRGYKSMLASVFLGIV